MIYNDGEVEKLRPLEFDKKECIEQICYSLTKGDEEQTCHCNVQLFYFSIYTVES